MTGKREADILSRIDRALKRKGLKGTINQGNQSQRQEHGKPVRINKPARPVSSYRQDNVASIFFTGSIGDVFAIESFMTEAQRSKLHSIYYATQKANECIEAFNALPNYPNLKVHSIEWTDFSDRWCFMTKAECAQCIARSGKASRTGFQTSEDYSIANIFSQINAGLMPYNDSSFIKHKVADLPSNIPDKYVTVCPFSTDKRLAGRDFDGNDWDSCLNYLRAKELKGVVTGVGTESIPYSDLLVDLRNKTTITEAIEVLKNSVGYIGIDSCMSVLATKILAPADMQIKSINPHLYSNLKCYYAPQTVFSFVSRRINRKA